MSRSRSMWRCSSDALRGNEEFCAITRRGSSPRVTAERSRQALERGNEE